MIIAAYTRNGNTNMSNGFYLMVRAPTTTTVTAAPKLADPGEAMKYVATVVTATRRAADLGRRSRGRRAAAAAAASPRPSTSASTASPSTACADAPVDLATGVATCAAAAPAAGGRHLVSVAYAGNDTMNASEGQDDFAVTAPAVSLSASALDFGPVTVGATGARSVTVTNSGTRDLHVGTATVSGPFTISSNGSAPRSPPARPA